MAIYKSKVSGVRYSLKVLGKSVKSIGMIYVSILLSYLSNDCLVLRGLGSPINSYFPLIKTLLTGLDLFNVLLIGRVDGFFWFNPGDLQLGGLLTLYRTFQLDPVNPYGRWSSISIFSFMNKKLFSCLFFTGMLLFPN